MSTVGYLSDPTPLDKILLKEIFAKLRIFVLTHELDLIPEFLIKFRRLKTECRKRYLRISFALVFILDRLHELTSDTRSSAFAADDQIAL